MWDLQGGRENDPLCWTLISIKEVTVYTTTSAFYEF